MTRYVMGRLVESVIVLVIMSFVIYALIGLMPGDPIDLMIKSDPRLTPADAARLRAVYGLDKPLAERYLHWAMAALSGDFGHSRLYVQPVLDVMPGFLLNTFNLMGLTFVISIVIAVPVGVYAALRQHSAGDYAINLACFAGISVPIFWLALMLIIVFAVLIPVLPASGVSSVGGGGFLDRARHLVLPVVTLTIFSIGSYTRFMRASTIEVMRQDYIRTAFAKGASRNRVVVHHALRNALLPVVTIIALSFGTLFSGALITETMFAYPGMGKLIYDSIMGNDFNMALVALLFATLVTLLANLAADIAYAWLDPRISYSGGGGTPR
ncbi:MAG: ABC transporter permease [Alphaproteobacteria bacterium]|nr:ABC transporter permease [Alphaproteobacteria bacterium]MCZ6610307.1 ABC transporter permease [Alphaproteobacteria bacterium]MCZ6743007.1 ABC transporter permease [Alphaproteobacteria bacterium]MCZ6847425.1 ABC transporter permease [Alphaproteobacteria bacterium]